MFNLGPTAPDWSPVVTLLIRSCQALSPSQSLTLTAFCRGIPTPLKKRFRAVHRDGDMEYAAFDSWCVGIGRVRQ
jgi:hypothetical protein